MDVPAEEETQPAVSTAASGDQALTRLDQQSGGDSPQKPWDRFWCNLGCDVERARCEKDNGQIGPDDVLEPCDAIFWGCIEDCDNFWGRILTP